MKEVYRTTNVVEISIIKSLLEEQGIPCHVFDQNVGGLYSGMLMIEPRVMVSDDDYEQALKIVKDCDFGK